MTLLNIKAKEYEQTLAFIEEARASILAGKVNEFAMIYSTNLDPEKTIDEIGYYRTHQWWFGNRSSIKCLGLVNYLADKILKYINGEEE